MTIKVTLPPGSDAEKAVKALLEKKQERQREFREAVEAGKLDEYARKQAFAQPIPVPKP